MPLPGPTLLLTGEERLPTTATSAPRLVTASSLLDDRVAVLREAPRDFVLMDAVEVLDAPLKMLEGELRDLAVSLGFLLTGRIAVPV
jgi:hypothetical protein